MLPLAGRCHRASAATWRKHRPSRANRTTSPGALPARLTRVLTAGRSAQGAAAADLTSGDRVCDANADGVAALGPEAGRAGLGPGWFSNPRDVRQPLITAQRCRAETTPMNLLCTAYRIDPSGDPLRAFTCASVADWRAHGRELNRAANPGHLTARTWTAPRAYTGAGLAFCQWYGCRMPSTDTIATWCPIPRR